MSTESAGLPGGPETLERWIEIDGVCTRYLEAGEGRPVVLLHSGEFGANAELSWERVIPRLAERYRVVAPDWLGFGGTDKIHDFVSGQRRRVKHMTRFLDVIGLRRAAFVGNSMGGTLLSRVMAQPAPAWSAAALVLASAGGFLPDNEDRRRVQEFDCTFEGMRGVITSLFHDPAWANDETYVQRRLESATRPGAWECCVAARLKSPLVPPRNEFGLPDETDYELIPCPTLIIAGAEDGLRLPGYAHEIAARVPQAELRVYSDCGHMPNVEKADRFCDDVIEFLARHYTPA